MMFHFLTDTTTTKAATTLEVDDTATTMEGTVYSILH